MAIYKRNENLSFGDFSVNGQRFRQTLESTDKREAVQAERDLIARARKVARKRCDCGILAASVLYGSRPLFGRTFSPVTEQTYGRQGFRPTENLGWLGHRTVAGFFLRETTNRTFAVENYLE